MGEVGLCLCTSVWFLECVKQAQKLLLKMLECEGSKCLSGALPGCVRYSCWATITRHYSASRSVRWAVGLQKVGGADWWWCSGPVPQSASKHIWWQCAASWSAFGILLNYSGLKLEDIGESGLDTFIGSQATVSAPFFLVTHFSLGQGFPGVCFLCLFLKACLHCVLINYLFCWVLPLTNLDKWYVGNSPFYF